MNFSKATPQEIGLILAGLNAVYVADSEKVRQKLIRQCETALAARGLKLAAA